MEKIYATIECIKKAFPEGIDHVYHELIACLKTDFTQQNLAALLSYLCGKEPLLIIRDIQTEASDTKPQAVMQALLDAGYHSA